VGIRSFADADTEDFWDGVRILRFQAIERIAMRKLQVLDAASSLNDLAVIPGSRLEKLAGDRFGQHSIRINDQWRVCFRWEHPNAHGVEINKHYS
jgi:proteic killer suppression protein